MLLDDNHIQGQIREWAELEALDEKARTSNQNQRAWEEVVSQLKPTKKPRKGGKILEGDPTDLVKLGNERCRVGSRIL